METLRIEILNPKAKKLLNDLADMKLISIEKQVSFKELLSKFRNNEYQIPSVDEIALEVREDRSTRYAQKN